MYTNYRAFRKFLKDKNYQNTIIIKKNLAETVPNFSQKLRRGKDVLVFTEIELSCANLLEIYQQLSRVANEINTLVFDRCTFHEDFEYYPLFSEYLAIYEKIMSIFIIGHYGVPSTPLPSHTASTEPSPHNSPTRPASRPSTRVSPLSSPTCQSLNPSPLNSPFSSPPRLASPTSPALSPNGSSECLTANLAVMKLAPPTRFNEKFMCYLFSRFTQIESLYIEHINNPFPHQFPLWFLPSWNKLTQLRLLSFEHNAFDAQSFTSLLLALTPDNDRVNAKINLQQISLCYGEIDGQFTGKICRMIEANPSLQFLYVSDPQLQHLLDFSLNKNKPK